MSVTAPPIGNQDELALRDLLEVLRRRAWLVVAALVLGGLCAGVFAAWRAPRFEAEAALLFQEEGGSNELLSSLASLPVDLGSLGGASARVTGEIEALRSRGVVRTVLLGASERELVAWVDDLDRQSAWRKLDERLGRALPPQGSLAVEVKSWPFALEEVEGLVLEFPRNDLVRAEREGLLADERDEAPFRPGEPVHLCGAELVLTPQGELAGRRFRLRVAGFERAALELDEQLVVQENPAGSGVVLVRLTDVDGARAAARVNALLAAYENECHTRRQRVTGRPIELLESERQRVLADLERAEQRLREFGERAGPIALPGAASAALEKLAEVDLERAKLELEAKVSSDLLARMQAEPVHYLQVNADHVSSSGKDRGSCARSLPPRPRATFQRHPPAARRDA
ncbi:MAG: Wzz/FepE/Etk N-terminal domain-containing protein [Planctomycetota bacterium]